MPHSSAGAVQTAQFNSLAAMLGLQSFQLTRSGGHAIPRIIPPLATSSVEQSHSESVANYQPIVPTVSFEGASISLDSQPRVTSDEALESDSDDDKPAISKPGLGSLTTPSRKKNIRNVLTRMTEG